MTRDKQMYSLHEDRFAAMQMLMTFPDFTEGVEDANCLKQISPHCKLHDSINNVIFVVLEGFYSLSSCYIGLGHDKINILFFHISIIHFFF